jgi:hypothetical protein
MPAPVVADLWTDPCRSPRANGSRAVHVVPVGGAATTRRTEHLDNDVDSDDRGVLGGEVEVDGTTYRISRSGGNARDVVRCSDGRRVGRVRGSPSSMWLVEAIEIDDELLRTIVRCAIEEGLLTDLATD